MKQTLGALLLLVLLVGQAAAAGDRKRARELYEQGTALYNVGEYHNALDKFKAAYLEVQDPVFLFNIGQCQRQLDDPAGAAASYKAYRREQPDAPNRTEVDKLIQDMETAAKANAERRNQPPTDVLKPQTPPPVVGSAPPPATPATTTSAPSATTLTAQPIERKPIYKKAWFWGVVGAGAVVVAAGVTLGVVLGKRSPSSTLLPDASY